MVNLAQYPQQPLLLLLHRRECGPTREVPGGGTGLSGVVLPPGEAGILFPKSGRQLPTTHSAALCLFDLFLLWLQAFPGFELPTQGVSVRDIPAGEASGSSYPGSPCKLHSVACWDMKPRLGKLCPLRLSRALDGLGRELPGTFGLGPRPSSSFTSGWAQLVVSVSETMLGSRKSRGWDE